MMTSDRRAGIAAWTLWWTTLLFATAQSAVMLTQPLQLIDSGRNLQSFPLITLAAALGATIGLVIVSRHPRNIVGWLFLVSHAVTALGLFADAYGHRATLTAWGSEPAGHILLVVAIVAGAPFALTLLGLVFLLFPDGRAPSVRWKRAGWAAIAGVIAWDAVVIIDTWPATTFVDNQQATGIWSALLDIIGTGLFLFLLAFTWSMFRRKQHAVGDERLQLRALCFSAAALVVATLGVLVEGTGLPLDIAPWVAQGLLYAAYPAVLVAACLAILKYRLYDIDIIINRTLVVGALALLVGAAYSGLVVGVGGVVGPQSDSSWPWIVSMVVIALAFQPAKLRVQRTVDRLLYGDRATPYEVLADLGRRLSAAVSSDELLPRLAAGVGSGVGAARARATVTLPHGDSLTADWPNPAPTAGFWHVVPVDYLGETVGELAVAMPPGRPLTAAGSRLVSDLARQAGLAMHNVRLTGSLQLQLREIELQEDEVIASRQRILTAAQVGRQRVQRDIEAGTALPLREVREALDALLAQPELDPAAAGARLAALADEVGTALDRLRDIARGVFPALLAERGLVAALQALVDDLALPARLELAADSERPDASVEAALYFCCVAALRATQAQTAADEVTIGVGSEGNAAVLSLRGLGGRSKSVAVLQSLPLQDMADRIEALGGILDVRASGGVGVDVVARVDARQPVQLPA